MRVLKWIVERVEGKAVANDTGALGSGFHRMRQSDWTGLSFDAATYESITGIDEAQWKQEPQLRRVARQARAGHANVVGRTPRRARRSDLNLKAASCLGVLLRYHCGLRG